MIFFGQIDVEGATVNHYWGSHRTSGNQWVCSDDVFCAQSESLVQPDLVTHEQLGSANHVCIMNKTSDGFYRSIPLLKVPNSAAVTVLAQPASCTVHASSAKCASAICPRHVLTEVLRNDDGTKGLVMTASMTDTKKLLSRFSVHPFHADVSSVTLFFQRADDLSVIVDAPDSRWQSWVNVFNKASTAETPKQLCAHSRSGACTAAAASGAIMCEQCAEYIGSKTDCCPGCTPATETSNFWLPNMAALNTASETNSANRLRDLPAFLFETAAVRNAYVFVDKPTFDNTAEMQLPPHQRKGFVYYSHVLLPETNMCFVNARMPATRDEQEEEMPCMTPFLDSDGDEDNDQQRPLNPVQLQPLGEQQLLQQTECTLSTAKWVQRLGVECAVATKLAKEMEVFYGIADQNQMPDLGNIHVLVFNVNHGVFAGCDCYAFFSTEAINCMTPEGWQLLWQGYGMEGDFDLGVDALCTLLCTFPLPFNDLFLKDNGAYLWAALDAGSCCYLEDLPGSCNHVKPSECLMDAASCIQPQLFGMLQKNGTQLELVPTAVLARLLPLFADSSDSLARIRRDNKAPLNRTALFEQGGVAAEHVVTVTLDTSTGQMTVTGNMWWVICASSRFLGMAYMPARLVQGTICNQHAVTASAMQDTRFNVLVMSTPRTGQPFVFQDVGVPIVNKGALALCRPFYTLRQTVVGGPQLPARQPVAEVATMPLAVACRGIKLPSAFSSVDVVFLDIPHAAPEGAFIVRLPSSQGVNMKDFTVIDGRLYKAPNDLRKSWQTTASKGAGTKTSKQVTMAAWLRVAVCVCDCKCVDVWMCVCVCVQKQQR